ncbi:hypothetical protein [Arthrobacter sp. SO3]|uniref:hypothetical protein n=1 Tax=Arthrobacter sp. SO3 TaxID=1897057 RepID=UPI001CFF59FC|nr:hypothetical protein [Arthrobacter sp. SO3]MCB5293674.1 hypothetical protein [Arthrobacter sp. SO3]
MAAPCVGPNYLGESMAGTLSGADVVQLRTLASQAGSSASALNGLRRRLAADLAASRHWQGNDAGSFRSDWETAHSRSLTQAVHLLETMRRELTANADQQEHASSAGGGSAAMPVATALPAAPPGVLPTPAELGAMSPQQVHDLWSGLGAERQAEFSRLHPFTAGNLDGLPVAARIEANKVAAAGQLAVLDANGPSTSEEARYLRKVLAGQISLVAYDPDKGNLIELLGRYDGSTTTVLTYVPGTFAKAGDFYAGGAQKMAAYLQQSDPAGSTAAFVYKNSEFPQDQTFVQSADKPFGEQAGLRLAAFEEGLAAQNPPAAQTVTVSHSWGEAAVASSEMFGTHYDSQISLSGAWMPEGWKADPATDYHHFAYDFDALATAQQLGLVGDKYPLGDPAFRKHIYDDPARNFEFGPVKITTDPMAKIENHSLIASAQDARNREAREDIARAIYGGRK